MRPLALVETERDLSELATALAFGRCDVLHVEGWRAGRMLPRRRDPVALFAVVWLCKTLYAIWSTLRGEVPETRQQGRARHSALLLEDLKRWLENSLDRICVGRVPSMRPR